MRTIKKMKMKIKKIINDIYNVNTYNIAASMANNFAFKEIKNLYNGKDVVLCGAGPTLAKYNPIPDAIHFALNRALLNEKVHFDYLIADDWDGLNFIQNEILEYDCIKFFGHQIGTELFRQIPESFVIANNAKRYYTDSYKVEDGFKSKFVCDIDKMAIGNMPNIALSAMQILLFTNPRRIFLVGCDASANGHFKCDEKLSKEQIEQHKKDLNIAVAGTPVINKWLELKEFAQTYYPTTEIISINPVGLKGIFKDEYTK